MNKYNTIQRCTLIVLGNINPAILHPEWFDRYKILPAQEVHDIIEQGPEIIKELGDIKVKFTASNVFVSGTETRLSLPSFRIIAMPEKFEASTIEKEKFNELRKLVVQTFLILEHTPVHALGINFFSKLKFSKKARHLMNGYFCKDPKAFSGVFDGNYLIDSRVRYEYLGSKVSLTLELFEEENKIGINFNYHKKLSDKEGTKELTSYLIDNFDLILQNAGEVVQNLFGNPLEGGKNNVKSGKDT